TCSTRPAQRTSFGLRSATSGRESNRIEKPAKPRRGGSPVVESATSSLESRLKTQALALGFDLAGIAPASEADGFDRLRDWLDRGFAGEMAYMHRHAEARRHPSTVLPEVRTVVMVGMTYGERGAWSAERGTKEEGSSVPRSAFGILRLGKVARYARG